MNIFNIRAIVRHDGMPFTIHITSYEAEYFVNGKIHWSILHTDVEEFRLQWVYEMKSVYVYVLVLYQSRCRFTRRRRLWYAYFMSAI